MTRKITNGKAPDAPVPELPEAAGEPPLRQSVRDAVERALSFEGYEGEFNDMMVARRRGMVEGVRASWTKNDTRTMYVTARFDEPGTYAILTRAWMATRTSGP